MQQGNGVEQKWDRITGFYGVPKDAASYRSLVLSTLNGLGDRDEVVGLVNELTGSLFPQD